MTAAERRDFETLPEFERALALRRADEAAKSPGRVVPDVEAWRPVAEAFVVAHAGRSDGSA